MKITLYNRIFRFLILAIFTAGFFSVLALSRQNPINQVKATDPICGMSGNSACCTALSEGCNVCDGGRPGNVYCLSDSGNVACPGDVSYFCTDEPAKKDTQQECLIEAAQRASSNCDGGGSCGCEFFEGKWNVKCKSNSNMDGYKCEQCRNCSDNPPPPPPPPPESTVLSGNVYCSAGAESVKIANMRISVKDSANNIEGTTFTDANGNYSIDISDGLTTGTNYAVRLGNIPLVGNKAGFWGSQVVAFCNSAHEICPFSAVRNTHTGGFDFQTHVVPTSSSEVCLPDSQSVSLSWQNRSEVNLQGGDKYILRLDRIDNPNTWNPGNWPISGDHYIYCPDGAPDRGITCICNANTCTMTVANCNSDGCFKLGRNYDWSVQVAFKSELTTNNGLVNACVTAKRNFTCNPTNPQTGSIQGRKYNDANMNHVLDNNELGILNWTITLRKSGDNSLIASQQTDTQGNFSFNNLAAGSYRICEERNQNGNWIQSQPTSGYVYDGMYCYDVILASGQVLTGFLFGNYQPTNPQTGSIEGIKYNDLNSNHILDNNEEGIDEWIIYLLRPTDNSIIASQLTDDRGRFDFNNLAAGNYRICEGYVNGWVQTYPTSGNTYNGLYCHDVTLTNGQVLTGYLFGNHYNNVGDPPATLSGYKYEDSNMDGNRDTGEDGLNNWLIMVFDYVNPNILITSTRTNASGNFSIIIAPGRYYICEQLQNGWTQSEPAYGYSIGTHCYDRMVDFGDEVTNLYFGNYESNQAGDASIEGRKYNDENGDGDRDSGEDGIRNWYIMLLDESRTVVVRSQYTDSNGYFDFDGLVPATYYLCESYQSGWEQTEPDSGDRYNNLYCYRIVLSANQTRDGYFFGNERVDVDTTARVSGTKYLDNNSNGNFDSGEPRLGGWLIRLYDSSGNLMTDLTDGNGNYEFSNLPSGSYTLCEEYRDGWYQIQPNRGTRRDGQYCYDFTLSTNQYLSGMNFGNRQGNQANNTQINGVKYFDANSNGRRDSNESNLSGWPIYLYDSNSNRIDFQYTNVAGEYRFSNLVSGTYYVCEGQQGGWVQTEPNFGIQIGGTFCRQVTLSTNQILNDQNFGNRQNQITSQGILQGYKWNDLDNDGVWDSNEPGISGWQIRIVSLDNAYVNTISTDTNGFYQISLDTGNYQISEIQRSGWVQTAPASPSYCQISVQTSQLSRCNFGNYYVIPTDNTPDVLERTGNDMQDMVIFMAFNVGSLILLLVWSRLRTKEIVD